MELLLSSHIFNIIDRILKLYLQNITDVKIKM